MTVFFLGDEEDSHTNNHVTVFLSDEEREKKETPRVEFLLLEMYS
jgi:hypothetical protein